MTQDKILLGTHYIYTWKMGILSDLKFINIKLIKIIEIVLSYLYFFFSLSILKRKIFNYAAMICIFLPLILSVYASNIFLKDLFILERDKAYTVE